MSEAAATVEFRRVWFLRGAAPKHWTAKFAVKDAPVCGWSTVAVLPGERRSTIFCPYSLTAHDVPNYCNELQKSLPADTATPAKMAGIITERWDTWRRHGYAVDYDVAALVLTRLGHPVPAETVDPDGEVKIKGGREGEPSALRPIRRDSERGRVVAAFMRDEPVSVREVMATTGKSRSNVLSHLFCASRDNGISYRLVGDCAVVEVPPEFDLFRKADKAPTPVEGVDRAISVSALDKSPVASTVILATGRRPPTGKPMDPSRLSPINPSSKRGAVARHFADWGSIADYVTASGLTRSGVLSHLYTIWQEHGVGHEVSPDGQRARLLYPEGHALTSEATTDKRKKSK